MSKKSSIAFYIAVPILIALIVAIFFYDRYQRQSFVLKYDENNVSSNQETNDVLPTIYCVGDSLTLGTSDHSYPEYLKSLVDNPITTYGDTNINSEALAIKLASQDIYINNLTIPGDSQPIPITLYNQDGSLQNALLDSHTGIEACTINNIEGTISYDGTNNQLLFTRNSNGSSTMITTLTKVTVVKPEFNDNSILILFTGSYEESINGSLTNHQNKIIQAFNTSQYLVVSLTVNDRNSTNNLLSTTYGDHYLDFKSYLLEHGLTDGNISASVDDESDLAAENVPRSLLSDGLNGNDTYNQLLANQIHQKLISLGYLK